MEEVGSKIAESGSPQASIDRGTVADTVRPILDSVDTREAVEALASRDRMEFRECRISGVTLRR